MTSSAFQTVKSIMSPVNASKLSGRYETTTEVKGKPVQVLRSIRQYQGQDPLVLTGSITPQKSRPSSDVDALCDLFSTKAKVTPSKKKPKASKATKAPSARNAKKTAGQVDDVKENLGKALKENLGKSTRFSDDTKDAVAPVRRSRRRSSAGN